MLQKLKKVVTVLLVSLLASGILTNCSKQDNEENANTDKETVKGKPCVALIMKSLANEFFKTMENGARSHQKNHLDKYDLICNGIKDEQDVNKQIEIVNQMIAKKVEAIVIAPANSKALISVCKKALEKGIIVINIDNKLDSKILESEKVRIPFVGPNNRKGAKLAGDFLAQQLQKGDQVAILEGKPGAFNGIQRKLGFEDSIKEAGLKLCTSQSAYWETNRAFNVAGQISNKFGTELKAILCANDSMALGAARALKDKDVLIIGFDNISAIQELIKEGKVVCTVDQHGDKIAVNGIVYALEILKTGNKLVDKETEVNLITGETLKGSGVDD